jgi:hypothetical protein
MFIGLTLQFSLCLIIQVQIHTKEPMGLLYKRNVNFFGHFSLFHMKGFLNEIFCNLLLKIHIVVPIDHMF